MVSKLNLIRLVGVMFIFYSVIKSDFNLFFVVLSVSSVLLYIVVFYIKELEKDKYHGHEATLF